MIPQDIVNRPGPSFEALNLLGFGSFGFLGCHHVLRHAQPRDANLAGSKI